MMDLSEGLSGRTVRFHLSAEGRKALRGLVPAGGSFQAFVATTSEMGPLIWASWGKAKKQIGEVVPVVLIRWDYIASLSFDYEYPVEMKVQQSKIGFRPV